MTTVVKVNRRNPNFTLYIGRAWAGLPESKWHNPFRIGQGTRERCLERYEEYVRSRPDLMATLHEIDDQTLGCWCHETPSTGEKLFCHGDVLIKLRNEQKLQQSLQRTRELTEEALHPTSPAPGHPEGCVCHRCRLFREQKEDAEWWDRSVYGW